MEHYAHNGAEDGDARAFRAVKLPAFWTESPDTWFSVVEAQFEAEGLTSSRRKFFCVVATLPLSVARNARHVISHPPAVRPYEKLRDFLTAAHTLTSYERVMQIQALGPLGGRKPSELLNSMLELCPPGEEETEWLRANFLSRLPEKVRILLLEDEEELRVIARRADRLIAHQGGQHVAAVSNAAGQTEEPSSVNAVQHAGRGRGRGRDRRGGAVRTAFGRQQQAGSQPSQPQQSSQPQQPSQPRQAQQQHADPSPMQLAVAASGLCRTHFKYGERAFTCFPPCTWQGN